MLDSAAYPDGSHNITVRAVDAAGHAAFAFVPVLFTNSPPTSPQPERDMRTAAVAPAVPVPSAISAPAPVSVLNTTTPSPVPTVGVQFHGIWHTYGDANGPAVLAKLADAGAKWVRMDVGWRNMEEAGRGKINAWYLDRLNRLVDAARSRGLKVLVTFYATPGWANGGKNHNVPPTDPAEYGRIAKVMARYFGTRVSAWEVWNEPNHPGFWTGSVAQYVALLKHGYSGFKAGSSSVPVVLGGPAGNDAKWLRAMYEAGGKGSFDIASTHPYMSPSDLPPETRGGDSTIRYVSVIKDVMTEFGDGARPIWFTEFGWSVHANTGSEPVSQRGVTAQQQADYLVRTLEMLRAEYPYVTNVFWYNERDSNSTASHYTRFGLMTRNLTPRPALTALKNYLARNS